MTTTQRYKVVQLEKDLPLPKKIVDFARQSIEDPINKFAACGWE